MASKAIVALPPPNIEGPLEAQPARAQASSIVAAIRLDITRTRRGTTAACPTPLCITPPQPDYCWPKARCGAQPAGCQIRKRKLRIGPAAAERLHGLNAMA